MLSHWNLIANADATAQVYSVDHTDCMLGVLPFFHSFGFTYTLWFPLLNGFKAVFHPNPTDAKAIGELAGAHHPTLFLSTPTFCLGYLRKCTREQFGSIRYLAGGRGKTAARAGEIVRGEVRSHAARRLWLHRNGTSCFGQRHQSRTLGVQARNSWPPSAPCFAAHRRSGNNGSARGRRNRTPAGQRPQPHARLPGRSGAHRASRWWTATTPRAIWPASIPTASSTSSIVWRASAKSRAKWCRT